MNVKVDCCGPAMFSAELFGGPDDGLRFSLPAPVPIISFIRSEVGVGGVASDRACIYWRDEKRWDGGRQVPYKFMWWD